MPAATRSRLFSFGLGVCFCQKRYVIGVVGVGNCFCGVPSAYYRMYMDDIKQFAKIEKELETLTRTIRIYSEDIEMEFGIEKYAMLIMKREKEKEQKDLFFCLFEFYGMSILEGYLIPNSFS